MVTVVLVVNLVMDPLVAPVERVDALGAMVVALAVVVGSYVLVFRVQMAGLMLNMWPLSSRVARLVVLGGREGHQGQQSDERKQIFHHYLL